MGDSNSTLQNRACKVRFAPIIYYEIVLSLVDMWDFQYTFSSCETSNTPSHARGIYISCVELEINGWSKLNPTKPSCKVKFTLTYILWNCLVSSWCETSNTSPHNGWSNDFNIMLRSWLLSLTQPHKTGL